MELKTFPNLILSYDYLITNPSPYFSYGDDIDEELVCSVCIHPFCVPMEHKTCGNSFCRSCSGKLKDCPLCRHPFKSSLVPSSSRIIRNLLDKLVVTCISCNEKMKRSEFEAHYNKTCQVPCINGCNTKITRYNYAEHWTSCPQTVVKCNNQNRGCLVLIYNKDLNEHTKECPFQILVCPYKSCGIEEEQQKMPSHTKICGFAPFQCTLCKAKFLRSKQREHVKVCPEEIIECSAKDVGCDFIGKRKDMVVHESSCVITKMKKTIEQLLTRLNEAEKNILELTNNQQPNERVSEVEKNILELITSMSRAHQQLIERVSELEKKSQALEVSTNDLCQVC